MSKLATYYWDQFNQKSVHKDTIRSQIDDFKFKPKLYEKYHMNVISITLGHNYLVFVLSLFMRRIYDFPIVENNMEYFFIFAFHIV